MRILLVHPGPEFSVADVYNGWHKALVKLGHEVVSYNTNDRLSYYSQARVPIPGGNEYHEPMSPEQATLAAFQGISHELLTFWPKLVIFVSGFFIRAEQLRLIRSRFFKIVMIHTESPYQDDEQLMRAQYAHLNLLNDPANLNEYSAIAPSLYMPHAYDPEIHYPRLADAKPESSDLTFIGTMFRSRQLFFEEMLSHLATDTRIVFGGSGWDQEHLDDSPLLPHLAHDREQCVANADTAEAYRDSRAGINFYRQESEDGHQGEGWAMGPREVEMAACGLPFLRDSRPESDEVFGGMLPGFESAGDAAEKLHWLLEREEIRKRAGERARQAIINRTFDNNVLSMFKKLGSLYRI